MREIEFIPASCKQQVLDDGGVIEPKFSGSIKMKMPSIQDRMGAFELMGVKYEGGEVSMADAQSNPVAITMKLLDAASKFVISVDLKNLESGAVYKSYEDLSYDPECDAILSELGMALSRGFRPSAKQKPL